MSIFHFDTHMHFDLYSNKNEVLNYLEQKKSYTIAVTNLPDLFERYIPITQNLRYVKLALGFHPELAYKYHNQLEKFNRNIKNTKYIGEIGLDYSINDKENQRIQRKIFFNIISQCNNVGSKILTIHSRKAVHDVLKILQDFQGKVILHWYSGNHSDMENALNLGYYFSINQQMIRSKAGRQRIRNLPLNRILIESDAPFTYGLKDNYSIQFMNEIYQYLSVENKLEIEDISKRLKENFIRLLSKDV